MATLSCLYIQEVPIVISCRWSMGTQNTDEAPIHLLWLKRNEEFNTVMRTKRNDQAGLRWRITKRLSYP